MGVPPVRPAAAAEFGPFDGRVWLNTAHQGPLPRPAVRASAEAAALKASPQRIADRAFTDIPERLRGLLARLVGGEPEQIVLGNSTSYWLHLITGGTRSARAAGRRGCCWSSTRPRPSAPGPST